MRTTEKRNQSELGRTVSCGEPLIQSYTGNWQRVTLKGESSTYGKKSETRVFSELVDTVSFLVRGTRFPGFGSRVMRLRAGRRGVATSSL